MKEIAGFVYKCIVGFETGFNLEGNEQWYYFLALVMDCMLTWWIRPELGIIYTMMFVIHYISTIVYGSTIIDEEGTRYAVGHYAFHAFLFLICMKMDCYWTLLTSAIVIVGYLLAPNCMGDNILMSM